LKVILQNDDPTPLYEQIKKQVIEQIIEGKLMPGLMLPSIRVLAKELCISVITIKKAYEDLEASGYIITRAGKGSYIAETRNLYNMEAKLKEMQHSFSKGIEVCREIGMIEEEIIKTFTYVLEQTL